MRLAVVAIVIATLAIAALSLSVFGESEPVTPVNGVFTVENAEQLIWVFENLGTNTVPGTSTIKLTNDINVEGKLPMVKKALTGVFDGNGKTISGISNPSFCTLTVQQRI